MDVSPQHQCPMALDLSKRYSVKPLTCGGTEAMDLDKKTEWYRRHPPNCSREVNPPYRSSGSYSSLSPHVVDGIRRDACLIPLHPEVDTSVHCREMEHGAETIGSYMNSTLAQGLQGLYPEEVHSKLWHSGFYGPNPPESEIIESSVEEDSESGSDVIFLVSTSKDSLLCSSVSRDSVSPILEPVSPATMSLDEGRSYLFQQALTSPSAGSTSSDDSSDSSVDIPVCHTRPVVLLSDLCAVYPNHTESPLDISSDDSDVVEVCVTHERKKAGTFPDYVSSRKNLAGETYVRNDSPKPRELRRSARIRKSASLTQEFSCSVPQYNLRNQNKNIRVFYDSGDIMEFTQNISSSEKDPSEQPSPTRSISSNSEDSDKDTRSVSVHSSKTIQTEPPHVQQTSCQASPQKSMKRKRKQFRSKQDTRKRIAREQHQTVPAGVKAAPKNQTPVKRRRRRKSTQTGPSTLSFPREPEIQFKYIKLKEERKKKNQECFRPFVRVEHCVCTVVNYQEDELSVRRNGKQQRSDSSCLHGFIPKTPCLQLGRLSSQSKCQATQACCLCGQSANAVGLGDLHGPYYPTGFQALGKSHKEEERSNGLGSSNGAQAADAFCDYDSSIVRSLKQFPVLDSVTKVPPYAEDCWIHEDCAVWATGVFLVKGRLYGLQEAARLARETLCCTCRQTGAIMGCFQKGCCRNYHYRCAILSGCVLNEDNFSMRCVKHKAKKMTRNALAALGGNPSKLNPDFGVLFITNSVQYNLEKKSEFLGFYNENYDQHCFREQKASHVVYNTGSFWIRNVCVRMRVTWTNYITIPTDI